MSLAVLAFSILGVTARARAATAVHVACPADDSIGSRLCFEVKEDIRKSAAFKLTSLGPARYEIVVVSVDDSAPYPSGTESAVAVSYNQFCGALTLESRLEVYDVGSHRVADVAQEILAGLDKVLDDPIPVATKAFGCAWTGLGNR